MRSLDRPCQLNECRVAFGSSTSRLQTRADALNISEHLAQELRAPDTRLRVYGLRITRSPSALVRNSLGSTWDVLRRGTKLI